MRLPYTGAMTTDTEELTPAQRAFLAAFPEHVTITATAAHLDMHRDTVYGWAERSAAFADALRQAKEAVADKLEAELMRRAMSGEGQMPDTLGIFLLKGYRPHFRERYDVTVNQTVTHRLDLGELSAEQRSALLSMGLEHEQRRLAAAEDVVEGEARELGEG